MHMIVAQGLNLCFQRRLVHFQSFVELSLLFQNHRDVVLSEGHIHMRRAQDHFLYFKRFLKMNKCIFVVALRRKNIPNVHLREGASERKGDGRGGAGGGPLMYYSRGGRETLACALSKPWRAIPPQAGGRAAEAAAAGVGAERMDHAIEDYGLIDDTQEGFRRNRSTKRQLGKLHSIFAEQRLRKQGISVVLYLDMQVLSCPMTRIMKITGLRLTQNTFLLKFLMNRAMHCCHHQLLLLYSLLLLCHLLPSVSRITYANQQERPHPFFVS